MQQADQFQRSNSCNDSSPEERKAANRSIPKEQQQLQREKSREKENTTMSSREGDSLLPKEGAKESERTHFDVGHELRLLLHIAQPSVCVQFNMYFLFPQTASSVGLTLGTEELAGFSLGSLVGNLTCLSIMIGALTAADTLMPRAYAAQRYSEVGRLAVRAVTVCIVLLIPPVFILCFATDWILVTLGQDPVTAGLTTSWIRVYLLGLPANCTFRISQRFLIAQHKPWPPVYASIIPSFVLQPILLRILMPIFGFEGSALAIVISRHYSFFYICTIDLNTTKKLGLDSRPTF
jgi:MATE family multidrug resistance protein